MFADVYSGIPHIALLFISYSFVQVAKLHFHFSRLKARLPTSELWTVRTCDGANFYHPLYLPPVDCQSQLFEKHQQRKERWKGLWRAITGYACESEARHMGPQFFFSIV
jgi:hypothetical protein